MITSLLIFSAIESLHAALLVGNGSKDSSISVVAARRYIPTLVQLLKPVQSFTPLQAHKKAS